MSHYRAVMATTIDCEGCEFDGEECTRPDGCYILYQEPKPVINPNDAGTIGGWTIGDEYAAATEKILSMLRR